MQLGSVKEASLSETMFRGKSRSFLYQRRSEQSEQKNEQFPLFESSHDRLSCARSRDSRHAITPFGWNMIKTESEDSARGPAAKPRPAGEMLKL
jgi:hypothetical protein